MNLFPARSVNVCPNWRQSGPVLQTMTTSCNCLLIPVSPRGVRRVLCVWYCNKRWLIHSMTQTTFQFLYTHYAILIHWSLGVAVFYGYNLHDIIVIVSVIIIIIIIIIHQYIIAIIVIIIGNIIMIQNNILSIQCEIIFGECHRTSGR